MVRVVDMRGREVRRLPARAFQAGEGRLRLDLSGLAPGAYVVRLTTPGGAASGRLAVVR